MRKNLSPLFLLPLLVSLTGCVSYFAGFPTNATQLNQPNFHYVKQNVSGQSTATYIIGIGGNNHVSMVAEAKENLLTEHPLSKNQALANVIVDFKYQSVFGALYGQKVCTYTADIVEFDVANAAVMSNSETHSAKVATTPTPPAAAKPPVSTPNMAVFIFENFETKEKYATHADFTQEAKYKKVDFVSANAQVSTFYAESGYFLPYIDELKYFYKNISLYSFIPRKTFWSSELQDGKVKCFNMENGQTILLDKSETAYLIPLLIMK
jgi:hypothetical protein